MRLLFRVPGDPVAQPRPRFSKRGFAYVPSKHPVHAWRERVSEEARLVLGGNPQLTYPRGGPFWVSAEFWMPRRTGQVWGTFGCRQDVDNLVKAVLDALLHQVWWDDRQIVQLAARKAEAPSGCLPGLRLLCTTEVHTPFMY